MTFFDEGKKEIISKDKNTFVNERVNQNKSLLLDENKEGDIKIQNTEGKNNSQIEREETMKKIWKMKKMKKMRKNNITV